MKQIMAEAEVVVYTPTWYAWNVIVYAFAVVGFIDVCASGGLWK